MEVQSFSRPSYAQISRACLVWGRLMDTPPPLYSFDEFLSRDNYLDNRNQPRVPSNRVPVSLAVVFPFNASRFLFPLPLSCTAGRGPAQSDLFPFVCCLSPSFSLFCEPRIVRRYAPPPSFCCHGRIRRLGSGTGRVIGLFFFLPSWEDVCDGWFPFPA